MTRNVCQLNKTSILSVGRRIKTIRRYGMSSIAMAADSTQSELMRRRKHKAKLARQSDKSRKQNVPGCSTAYKTNRKQVKLCLCIVIFR